MYHPDLPGRCWIEPHARARRARAGPLASAPMPAALPEFAVIGTQKGGTTTLWHRLRSHPDLFLPSLKEPNFFLEEGNWHRGLDWYRDLFAPRRAGQIAGEVSPGYTMFPTFAGVPRRMRSVLPEVRLVYLIREPVSRMVSNWAQSRVDHLEHRPLGRSLLSDLRYVSLSQYATQLEQYLEHFGRDSLLVLKSEDLSEDPEATLGRICRFIGVDPAGLAPDDRRLNQSADKRMPTAAATMAYRLAGAGPGQAAARTLLDRLAARGSNLTHRPFSPQDVELGEELRGRLASYLSVEMRRLRDLIGPDIDLWGYA